LILPASNYQAIICGCGCGYQAIICGCGCGCGCGRVLVHHIVVELCAGTCAELDLTPSYFR